MRKNNKKPLNKYMVIATVILVLIVIIAALNIRLPEHISINQDVTEFSVTRGKDGEYRKVYDDDKSLVSKLDGMKLKSYSLLSVLKGDTLRSGGWVYGISYKEADGDKKYIVISPGEVKYKGKSYTTNDSALNDIISELDRIYAE